MSLVTVQEYRDITRDVNTAAEEVSARIEEATDLVEEYLQRRLRFGTYTEELEIWDAAYAYPEVTPIVSVPSGASYAIDVGAVRFRSVLSDLSLNDWLWYADPPGGIVNSPGIRPLYATLVYDGGYTNATCPQTLKRGIARVARGLVVTNPQRVLGATSISVGDVSVSYPKAIGDIDVLVPGITITLKPYKRKRVRF